MASETSLMIYASIEEVLSPSSSASSARTADEPTLAISGPKTLELQRDTSEYRLVHEDQEPDVWYSSHYLTSRAGRSRVVGSYYIYLNLRLQAYFPDKPHPSSFPAALPSPTSPTAIMSNTKTLPPSKLAHVVLKTNFLDRQTQFYCNFLGARVVYDGPFMKLMTYDDEHHRIAVVQLPETTPKDHQSSGLMHIAFTFDSLSDLCKAYRQRKEVGITPGWCVNHGPTTSM